MVAYLGWHGQGNLGDDAIYDTVRGQLPGARFVELPRLPHEVVHVSATTAIGFNRSLRHCRQVVGGGTIVGRRQWRFLVNRGLALTRGNGSYAIGVGVEDPVFAGRNSGSGQGELKRWASILSRFHLISARGPRSAELLSDVGLDVEVSGDPALLLPQPDVVREEGLIGVNLGFGDDLWGHDPVRLAGEMSVAIKRLSAQGHRVVGILMNAEDRRWTEMALGNVPAEIVLPANPQAAARELARCSTAIVTRLHANVLASVSGTPVVSLEYQPKCRDFTLAIDNEQSLIRTDKLTSTAVVDSVADAVANASNIRIKTRAAVAALRQRLQTEYAGLAAELCLNPNVAEVAPKPLFWPPLDTAAALTR